MEPTIFKPRLKFKPPLKFFKFGHWLIIHMINSRTLLVFTFEMILEIRNRENNIFSVFRSRTEQYFFVLNEFDDLFTPETYFTISSMVFY